MYQIPYHVAKQAMAGYSAHFEKWASQSPSWDPNDPNVVAAFAQEYEVKMAAQQAEEEKIASDSDMAGTRMADAFVGRLQEYGFDLGAFGVKEAAVSLDRNVERIVDGKNIGTRAMEDRAIHMTRNHPQYANVHAKGRHAATPRTMGDVAGHGYRLLKDKASYGWAKAKEHASDAVALAKKHPYAAGAVGVGVGGAGLYAAHRNSQKKASDIQFENDVAYATDYYAGCAERGEQLVIDNDTPYNAAVTQAAFDNLQAAGWEIR